MKITGIEIYHADIPYPEPYVLAHGAWTSGSQVILQVHTDEGISGLGESTFAGGKQWRGNDRETVTSVLSQRFGPALEGKDPLAIERRIDEMEELDYNANAVTAVDNALWDIAGKVYNVPVYQLLGGLARRTISVSRSLPVQDAETMARKAVGLQKLGYQLITVKIGFDPREDLERVRAVPPCGRGRTTHRSGCKRGLHPGDGHSNATANGTVRTGWHRAAGTLVGPGNDGPDSFGVGQPRHRRSKRIGYPRRL